MSTSETKKKNNSRKTLIIPPWSKMNVAVVIILVIAMCLECGQYIYSHAYAPAVEMLEQGGYSKGDIVRELDLVNIGFQEVLRISGFLGLILFAGVYGKKKPKDVWACVIISSVYEIYRAVRNATNMMQMITFYNDVLKEKLETIQLVIASRAVIDKILIVIVFILFALTVCGKIKQKLITLIMALVVILIETAYYIYYIMAAPSRAVYSMILYAETVSKMFAIILLLVCMVQVRRLKKKTSATGEDRDIGLKKENLLLTEEEADEQEKKSLADNSEEDNKIDKETESSEGEKADAEEFVFDKTYEDVLKELKDDDDDDDDDESEDGFVINLGWDEETDSYRDKDLESLEEVETKAEDSLEDIEAEESTEEDSEETETEESTEEDSEETEAEESTEEDSEETEAEESTEEDSEETEAEESTEEDIKEETDVKKSTKEDIKEDIEAEESTKDNL